MYIYTHQLTCNVTKIMTYLMCVCAKSLQSCPTLCNPMDCSPPGSSIQGILQARILECFPPGDLSNPGIEAASLMSPALIGGFFTTHTTWEAHDPLHIYIYRMCMST